MKMNRLYLSLLALLFSGAALAQPGSTENSAQSERVISVDVNTVKGPMNTMFNECVGAGRANEGLRADWQQQLTYVKKKCGFRYIRMHGLLTDDMGVFKIGRDGKPEYSYMYIDALFDFLQSIGMKPFVELGFMPAALASGNQTIFWWQGNVTPPRDYEMWADLIKNLTQHFTDRYGTEEVKSWYFEVWNEPNLSPGFWSGTQAEYFKLYKYAARAVKSVNPDYRVGGPATAGAAWETELINYCQQNNVPIDFISTHSYGVKQGYLDEYGNTGTRLAEEPMSVSGDVLQSRKEIENSSMPGLELHYTEWSSSYTPADPIHDSYHEAPYVLQKIKQVGDAANSMSYWVFTDIFEEPGPRFEPFHGGFGMLTIQGINKPVFYAYQFMNQLGADELVNNDPMSWVCKDKNGNIQVLAWDYTYTLPDDSINNQQYYIQDLPSSAKGELKVMLTDVPAGKYALEICRVGYRNNDAYTTYLDMNKPAHLSQVQVKEIKNLNNGAPETKEIVTVGPDGKFSKSLDLRENDVYFLNLVRL